jgi:hypothetical protein
MLNRKRSYYTRQTFASLVHKIFSPKKHNEKNMPDMETREYLAASYPSNHNYLLKHGKLIALRRLAKRYSSITALYPKEMKSLLDLSCSKGYFVHDAVQSYRCERSMGIDVMEKELAACTSVKKYLGDEKTNFKKMRLHEIAPRIDQFGGPVDVALVINCYQYLYFGSEYFTESYMSHDKIFSDLRDVCNGRVIFSNRMEFERLQNYPAKKALGPTMTEIYDEETAYAAASKYFKVNRLRKLGRNPLWTMDSL